MKRSLEQLAGRGKMDHAIEEYARADEALWRELETEKEFLRKLDEVDREPL